ncbi:MAG: aconitase X [Intestinimonas sp.]
MDDAHRCDNVDSGSGLSSPRSSYAARTTARSFRTRLVDRHAMIVAPPAPPSGRLAACNGRIAFVTTESSNVLYSNSILGARGYGGGGSTTFCAAICGRAPKQGSAPARESPRHSRAPRGL